MEKEIKKSRVKFNSLQEIFPYFKSILEPYKGKGVVIQGNAFIGKTKKGGGGIFIRMRFEILKGKPLKEKKLPFKE